MVDHARHQHGFGRGPKALVRFLLLVGLALYFARLSWSGDLGNYINLRYVWLSIAATGLFAVLAANTLVVLFRDAHKLDYGQHLMSHMHRPPTWSVLLVSAVPLVLGLLVPSKPLGSSAITGELNVDISDDAAVVPAMDSLQWTVLDWLRVFSTGQGERFKGRPADVTGFVYRRDGDPNGSFRVTRFIMVCCSADAYAVGVPVIWRGGEDLPLDTWVRVQGPVNVGDFRGQRLPIIAAGAVQTAARPSQPYLYQ